MTRRAKKHLALVRDKRSESMAADLLSHALSSASITELLVRDLGPDDFSEADRPIFEALKETFTQMRKVDLDALAERTGWDAMSRLMQGPSIIPYDGVFGALREIRQGKAVREAQQLIGSGDYGRAGDLLARIGSEQGEREVVPGRVTDSVVKEFLTLQEANRHRGFLGPKTGLAPLDRITLGLAPGSVWAISGATSTGKSTLLLQVSVEATLDGAIVAVFSLEMPAPWVLARLAGAYMRKSPKRVFMGELDDTERDLVKGTLEFFQESRLHVLREATEVSEICRVARKIRAAHSRLDIVVVDFIQNVWVRDAVTQMERMATAAVEFQRLAGELNTCVLIASQLSNEAVREKGSGILSLRYASELVHAADVGIELVARTDGTVDLLVRKNRIGQLGKIPLSWTGEWSRFEVVADDARLHSGRGRTGKDHAAGDGRD